MAIAALASCTKTEVNYGESSLISIAPIAKVNTKAAVQGTYPTDLPLLVYANAGIKNTTTPTDITSFTEVYLDDSEFTHSSGVFTNATAFWPNVKALIFAGVSKSGNVSTSNVAASFPTANTVTVTGYQQPDTGDNDLMWFQHTTPETSKSTDLEVTMQHACSWLVFNFKGDAVTASATQPWKVTKVVVKSVSKNGTATLGASAEWSSVGGEADYVVYNEYTADEVVYETEGTALTAEGVSISNDNNVVVIPQAPKQLEITYEFKAPSGNIIKETKEVSLAYANPSTDWVAGKKYTYDITIGTAQIKIAPTASTWGDYDADSTTDGTQNIDKTVN